jgi:hypothetical protein
VTNEDESILTYKDLKSNSEKCRHPKEVSGAKQKAVAKISLLFMMIISCLFF